MLVLGVLLILFGLGLSFIHFVGLRQENSSVASEGLYARSAAEAGLSEAMGLVRQNFKDNYHRVIVFNEPWFHLLSNEKDMSYEVFIQDEAAKVNLNVAPFHQAFKDSVADLFNQLSLDGSLFDSSKWNARSSDQWFFSIQELTGYLKSSKRALYHQIAPYLTVHSYDWNDDGDGYRKVNAWSLFDEDLSAFNEKKLENLYEDAVEGRRVVSQVKDFFDEDREGSLGGIEHPIWITEVRYETSSVVDSPVRSYDFLNSHGGEYIEIHNPYLESISLGGYRLEWESQSGRKQVYDLSDDVLASGGYLVFTDHTKRLQFIDHVPVDSIREINQFELKKTVVRLFYLDEEVDRFDLTSHLVSKDKALEKDDPRNHSFDNFSEGFSPSLQNTIYQTHANTPTEFQESELFLQISDIVSQRDGIHFLKYVYRADQPWTYLKLHAKDLVDINSNGLFDANEAGDFVLLQNIFFLDEENIVDYYDDIDDVQKGFKSRLAGKININTASVTVLKTLPGVTTKMAEEIVKSRKIPFAHIYDVILPLKKVLSDEQSDLVFWDMVDQITVRSHVFSIMVKGTFGLRTCFLQAIVDDSKTDGRLSILSKKVRML
jgi:hypothetical protein